jgi:hypothetical protein
MARRPKNPEEYFPEITSDLRKAFGDDLVSVILYGSGAGGDYNPRKTDLNFIIVFGETGIGDLERAFSFVNRWSRRQVATPLFMTKAFITSSLDAYPMEFLGMKRHHLLVWGEDVLAEITVDPGYLRLQLEREIKGKLLHLRLRYLETGGKTRRIRKLIAASVTAFISIFKALLHLKGLEFPPGKREVIRAAASAFAIDPNIFLQCIDIKDGMDQYSSAEVGRIFPAYLGEVARLSEIVDTLTI